MGCNFPAVLPLKTVAVYAGQSRIEAMPTVRD